ncbi:hypothetical protein LN042_00440 [Kitasatospora sp. RB6PN24]|uniref:hypothetical protein n=1 Tax=Kitasatospora humi TaxID=2893891 RepID=UPI001E4A675B|nr:hypothetical protein [Kitasatospora humi]MCC9305597.1 hypothetical protein [Kitasatospora humi]
MKNLRALAGLFLAPLLLPLQLALPLLRVTAARARAARAAGDRGALSIELALIVVVVVAIAGAIVAALATLGQKAKGSIPQNLPIPANS